MTAAVMIYATRRGRPERVLRVAKIRCVLRDGIEGGFGCYPIPALTQLLKAEFSREVHTGLPILNHPHRSVRWAIETHPTTHKSLRIDSGRRS